MAIYLFAHTKGGTGKSTTAVNMATMRQAAGRKVVLVDADPGRSATEYANRRRLLGLAPEITCVSLVSYPLEDGGWYPIGDDLRRLAERFDDVIIDAGGEGHGSPEIRMSLLLADKVVTPCRTPQVDTDRLAPMNTMIQEARTMNPKLKALLFPTCASTNAKASDVVEFYSDVAKFKSFKIMETVVRNRDCYTKWRKTGEAVFEQKRLVKAAMQEMSSLYKEVFA